MTTNHTLRPVIDELRAADPMDAPPGFPPIELAADVVVLDARLIAADRALL